MLQSQSYLFDDVKEKKGKGRGGAHTGPLCSTRSHCGTPVSISAVLEITVAFGREPHISPNGQKKRTFSL